MVLLARTADRLYWGARYVERAEDTARIIRAFNELVVDYPSDELLRWEPLVAIHGSVTEIDLEDDDPAGELTVLRLLIADRENPSSITSSVTAARANLRTTREVLPREAAAPTSVVCKGGMAAGHWHPPCAWAQRCWRAKP